MDKACYNEKINRLINDGISKGVYVIEENDNTLTELKSFQNFICRNFKKYEKYKEMRPTSSQPARLFATAETHKFTDIKQININDLKLHPIIDQTGTHLYDCNYDYNYDYNYDFNCPIFTTISDKRIYDF